VGTLQVRLAYTVGCLAVLLAAITAPADDVVSRARRYVEQYLPQLATLVAEEHYTQQLVQPAGGERRSLVSEMATVRADDGMWVAFRDVWKVDEQELPNRRARLEALFGANRVTWAAARPIIEESARYNLGPRLRTFNTPVAALELLSPTRTWCCRVKVETEAGAEMPGAAVLVVRETGRPTLIRGPEGEQVRSTARFWIDPRIGAILKWSLEVGEREPVKLDVRFRHDPALELWVPDEMRESFRVHEGFLTGTARYSNYRRFSTQTRILDR
jgi:hypothetical protein